MDVVTRAYMDVFTARPEARCRTPSAPIQIINQNPNAACINSQSLGIKSGETAAKHTNRIVSEHITPLGSDSPLLFFLELAGEIRKRIMGGGLFPLPRGHVTVDCIDQAGMFIVVAVNAKQFPVAAILRIIVMVVVAVVNCQLLQIFPAEFTCTTATDPGVQPERFGPVSLLAIIGSTSRPGDDLIQFIL